MTNSDTISFVEPKYEANKFEQEIYKKWEESGAFSPKLKVNPPAGGEKLKVAERTFTIIMPPPNANASLHAGHGMYTIEDILIRWKRMQGFSALWIPGMDHAGFETQFVYEKYLAKEGKSRMDFDRKTLYENVAKFVKENSGLIFKQFRRLGFSADWERMVFSLDKNVVDYVFDTFKKLVDDKLVYRGNYLVNYCPHCGTSLAELEVVHEERGDKLYYVRYGLTGEGIEGTEGLEGLEGKKYIVVATTRPETMLGDTAVAVNPKDTRYKELVGKMVNLPLTKRKIPIIADEMADMEFGTGMVKITPAHDANDYKVGKRHNLEEISVIDINGRLRLPKDAIDEISFLEGKKTKVAREEIVKILKNKDLIEKIDDKYPHLVSVCYKCKRDLEPNIIPNWFIKVEPLKPAVVNAVKKDEVKFHPERYKQQFLSWMEIMHDWPISRQIAWGIRIPAWYDVETNPDLHVVFLDKSGNSLSGSIKDLLKKYKLADIENGLQTLSASSETEFVISKEKPGEEYLQETDTFDTWFSSGQWPLVTLKDDEYKSRFPTDVMGTLSEILKFWVSRMMMFSLYRRGEIPFKNVYLWSMVTDAKGQKMSKSKGNVINPIDLVDKYGADAFRMALIYGTAAGSKIILSEDRVRAMRNFTNKIWNAVRFVLTKRTDEGNGGNGGNGGAEKDKKFLEHLNQVIKEVTKQLNEYRIGMAAETIYNEFWHWFCDEAIEDSKKGEISQENLLHGLIMFLKLLHPFVPFVTEKCWEELGEKDLLIKAEWPALSQPRRIRRNRGIREKIIMVIFVLGFVASMITMLEDNRIKSLWEERKEIEIEIEKLAELTIKYPDYRDLLYRLGANQRKLGNGKAAKEAWERAGYLDPNGRVIREIREIGGIREQSLD